MFYLLVLKNVETVYLLGYMCIYMPTHFHSYVVFSFQNVHPDKEILADVVMCLWQKCKTELQQIQRSGSDCLEYIHKHQAYQVLLHYVIFLLMRMQSVIVKPVKYWYPV